MKTVTTNEKMFNITNYSGNNSYLRTANQERHLLLHRWQLMCKTESSNFQKIWEMSQNQSLLKGIQSDFTAVGKTKQKTNKKNLASSEKA